MNNYFTLLVWRDDRWEPDFGSYDKFEVEQELSDTWFVGNLPKTHFKIIRTSADQTEINAKVRELNAITAKGEY